MIVHLREWFLLPLSSNINEVQGFIPYLMLICLWSEPCFFLLKALRLDLV